MSILTSLWKMPSNGLSFISVVIAVGAMGAGIYQEVLQPQLVVIASSPAKAEITLDGENIGTTPLTIELKKGTFTLEARKNGYEPLEHAVYVSTKESNIVNLQLLPLYQNTAKQVPTEAVTISPETSNLQNLTKEVNKIKSLIVSNPEEAATIPILNERMRIHGIEVKALRDEIKGIKEQGKWYLGSMIAIIVGLLGVIASLFIANKGK